MASDRHSRSTHEERPLEGNRVFEKVAAVLGLDVNTAKKCVAQTLATIGTKPHHATIEEVAALLPEFERRLRLFVPDDIASAAYRKLRALVLTWE